MARGLIDPRSHADVHAAVLALRGIDVEIARGLREATRDVNRAGVDLVRSDQLRVPPHAYARVYARIADSLRPIYSRATGTDVSAGGISARFVRGGRQLVGAYEYGARTGDMIRGSTGRPGQTRFPTRSRYGWFVGASAYEHLDEIVEPWLDAVEQVVADAFPDSGGLV